MKKGVLKKIGFWSLTIVGAGVFVGGMLVGSKYHVDNKKTERKEILNEYMATLQYHDVLDEKIEVLQENYRNGTITTEEFEENIKNYSTEEFIEETINAKNNQYYINKLSKVDEELNTYQSKSTKAMMVALGGAYPFALGVANLVSESITTSQKKNKKVISEEKE